MRGLQWEDGNPKITLDMIQYYGTIILEYAREDDTCQLLFRYPRQRFSLFTA